MRVHEQIDMIGRCTLHTTVDLATIDQRITTFTVIDGNTSTDYADMKSAQAELDKANGIEADQDTSKHYMQDGELVLVSGD